MKNRSLLDNVTFFNATNSIDTESLEKSEHVCILENFTTLHSFENCIRDNVLSQMHYMSLAQIILFTFLYVCLSFLGVLGNGLVMCVVIRKREMRTTRNVFIMNLALSNFLLALILVPFLWTPTYKVEFPFGAFVCKFAQSFPGANIFCSSLTVSAIAVDRYCVIVRKRLGSNIKSIQTLITAILIWIVSFLLSLVNLLHFNIKDYILPLEFIPRHLLNDTAKYGVLLFQRCELLPQQCSESDHSCYQYYELIISVLSMVFIYGVPMPILLFFSCLLTRFLARNERKHSSLRHRAVPPDQFDFREFVVADSEIQSKNTVPPSNSGNSLMLKTHHSYVSKNRSHTTRLLFAMAFSNAILWLPFIVISMFIQVGPRQVTLKYYNELRQMDDVAKLISMFTICMNPMLYGYLNRNFQNEFKLIFTDCIRLIRSWRSNKMRIQHLRLSRQEFASASVIHGECELSWVAVGERRM